ncbi:MAG: queuosine precursor transporter [Bacteroidales bacterium]|nr:queuosine precursor transporter [Bacteroidales bacterium]
MNELILISALIFIYGTILLSYRLFGKSGLYCMSVLATILANIEVVILIRAFGIEQTLGNVLFASTFLITDILSECEGRKSANKAVLLGIFSAIFFLILTQSWGLYEASENDTMQRAAIQLFSYTSRIIFASLIAYIISQFFDIWLYHTWWKFTEIKSGSHQKFLWLRNNGSTLISQFVNTLIFTFLAFAGTYSFPIVLNIFISSYLIYAVAGLLDTPIVYLARKSKSNHQELLND